MVNKNHHFVKQILKSTKKWTFSHFPVSVQHISVSSSRFRRKAACEAASPFIIITRPATQCAVGVAVLCVQCCVFSICLFETLHPEMGRGIH